MVSRRWVRSGTAPASTLRPILSLLFPPTNARPAWNVASGPPKFITKIQHPNSSSKSNETGHAKNGPPNFVRKNRRLVFFWGGEVLELQVNTQKYLRIPVGINIDPAQQTRRNGAVPPRVGGGEGMECVARAQPNPTQHPPPRAWLCPRQLTPAHRLLRLSAARPSPYAPCTPCTTAALIITMISFHHHSYPPTSSLLWFANFLRFVRNGSRAVLCGTFFANSALQPLC